MIKTKELRQYKLIVIIAGLYTLFYNLPFFNELLGVYPLDGINIVYDISVGINLFLFIVFCFTVLSSRYTTKPFLIVSVMVSSFTTYFMNTYHVIIDYTMLQNALQTNLKESLDLFSYKLVLYVIFLGIIPSIYIYKTKITYYSLMHELKTKLKIIFFILLLVGISMLSFSAFYTSFFREHSDIKFHANPTFWVYSVVKYFRKDVFHSKIVLKPQGLDAKITKDDDTKNKIVILVVGEATRADHFWLNGYKRQTNPLISQEDIINFSNMNSCGTATAVSVPCMFSMFDRGDYSYTKGLSNENVLDILNHTNEVSILWRENNSDSKGVALRVPFEDYQTDKLNSDCDDECRDEGMLVGLDKYIEKNKSKNILIVLHQMGNHGPAYYKRYKKEFEKFTPVCKTNQLEECSDKEIINAYDNALLHTDSFLSDIVNFLKPYSKEYATAMIYMSDHGESLGENGLYLHGIPYALAPDTQTHVASLMWFGDEMKKHIDVDKLKQISDKEFSQDYLFHTLLGIFNVKTKLYNKDLDMIPK